MNFSNLIDTLAGAWQSKTIWAALVVFCCGVLVQLGYLQSAVQPAWYGWILMGLGVAMGALRVLTSTSLAGKIPGTAQPPAK